MDIDQLLHEYADKLQEIYDKRTAGDYTFFGFLADFYRVAHKGYESELMNLDKH